MRHRKRVKKLGRSVSHRQAVLANLATALIERERIQTTDSLAKGSQKLVERLITKAKVGTLHARRQVLKVIKDKKVVAKLFDTIAPRYSDRNGGYVRLIKVGNRIGDGAAISVVELIGSELVVEEPKKRKKKRKKEAEEVEESSSAQEQLALGVEDQEEKEREIEPEQPEGELAEEKSSKEETPSEEEPDKDDSADEVKKKSKADAESMPPQKESKGSEEED